MRVFREGSRSHLSVRVSDSRNRVGEISIDAAAKYPAEDHWTYISLHTWDEDGVIDVLGEKQIGAFLRWPGDDTRFALGDLPREDEDETEIPSLGLLITIVARGEIIGDKRATFYIGDTKQGLKPKAVRLRKHAIMFARLYLRQRAWRKRQTGEVRF